MKRYLLFGVYGIIFCITIIQCVTGIHTQPIEQWDEQTNSTVVRESYRKNTFPFLIYQSKPFFEKPPLWYYIEYGLVALGYNTLASFRIVSSFSGILLILCTAYAAKRWWGNKAFLTTWIVLLFSRQMFITNIGGYFSTHTVRSADVDALLILFIMIAVLTALSKKPTKLMSISTGVLIGAAMLTKGPSGFLILIPLSLWFFYQQKKNLILLLWCSAFGIFLPWFFVMLFEYKFLFLNSFFTYHIGTRIFSAIEGHTQSYVYYLSLMSNPLLYPPGILLAYSLIIIFYKKLFLIDKRIGIILFCFILYLIVPSVMQTKLAWYILPVYPFAALLIGSLFAVRK